MKRRMLFLTERQEAALRAESKERDVPVSEIIREMIEARYGLEHERVEPGRPYVSPRTSPTTQGKKLSARRTV